MCLENLSGCELVALASISSIYIAEGLSCEQMSILANFFTSLGDNLNILASQNCKGR